MTLNFKQISSLIETIESLQDSKMPFKLSMIFAKNLALLKKEEEFYIEQERKFAMQYLQYDEEKQEFKQAGPGVFAIKEGLEEDCRKAREEIDAFTSDVELRTIPMSTVENMEFTPKQLMALELILEEEE